jgi:transposase
MGAAGMQLHGHGSPTRRLIIVRRANARRAAAAVNGESIAAATVTFLEKLHAEGENISLSTLYNWLRAYRMNGADGLTDHRWRKPAADVRFLKELQRLYELPDMLCMESVYALARREACLRGWRECTFRQASQYLRRHVLPAIRRGAEPLIDRSSNGD